MSREGRFRRVGTSFCAHAVGQCPPWRVPTQLAHILRGHEKPAHPTRMGGSDSISSYSEEFELVRWRSGVIYKFV